MVMFFWAWTAIKSFFFYQSSVEGLSGFEYLLLVVLVVQIQAELVFQASATVKLLQGVSKKWFLAALSAAREKLSLNVASPCSRDLERRPSLCCPPVVRLPNPLAPATQETCQLGNLTALLLYQLVKIEAQVLTSSGQSRKNSLFWDTLYQYCKCYK